MRKEADNFGRLPKGYIKYLYATHQRGRKQRKKIDSLINAETWKNGKEWQEFFDIEVSEKSQATACKSEYLINITICRIKLKEQATTARSILMI